MELETVLKQKGSKTTWEADAMPRWECALCSTLIIMPNSKKSSSIISMKIDQGWKLCRPLRTEKERKPTPGQVYYNASFTMTSYTEQLYAFMPAPMTVCIEGLYQWRQSFVGACRWMECLSECSREGTTPCHPRERDYDQIMVTLGIRTQCIQFSIRHQNDSFYESSGTGRY